MQYVWPVHVLYWFVGQFWHIVIPIPVEKVYSGHSLHVLFVLYIPMAQSLQDDFPVEL
jgi:hypothetical protein